MGSSHIPAVSAEASHTTPIASEHNLPRASVSYSEPLSENPFSDLLHPSPPLRRRKGSMALRKKTSDSATADSTKSQVAENQNASYSHDQDHTADIPEYSVTYLNPTHDGKMSEARGNQNVLSGEHQGKTSEITESSETSTSSENDLLKPKTSGSRKADTVLGYGREGKVTPKKSMTNLVTSPKASREKISFRKLFHRKGSTECTTPPSSSGTSGKAAGRMTISAPTFVDASPNAKNLLNSAHSLVDASPGAKNVVNYSRPMAHHSSSDVSKGSPVGRGRSSSALPGSNPFSDPSTSPEGLTEKSENGPIGLNTSPVSKARSATAQC